MQASGPVVISRFMVVLNHGALSLRASNISFDEGIGGIGSIGEISGIGGIVVKLHHWYSLTL